MNERLHLATVAASGSGEFQQSDRAVGGRNADEARHEREYRCRKSDHPFPPWIGGRPAAAASGSQRWVHKVCLWVARSRSLGAVGILPFRTTGGVRAMFAIVGRAR